MTIAKMNELERIADISAMEIVDAYAREFGDIRPKWYVKNRVDGPFLIIEFANPGEHHHKILNGIVSRLSDDNIFKERATVQRRKTAPAKRLLIEETRLLVKEIAESLTIDRHSFDGTFFFRYTPSVAGFEQKINARANFAVYGRRGAGKSSLLAYAMQSARRAGAPYSWVAMQTFANRSDKNVVPAVIAAIIHDLRTQGTRNADLHDLNNQFDILAEDAPESVLAKCDKLIPKTRRVLGALASSDSPFTIFVDDIHVIAPALQPLLLGFIYKITRGNNMYIKISGIDLLTKIWEPSTNSGLQPTHDVQLLKLDLNLTQPDESKRHIVSILDAHARYCGLPSIGYLADDDVLSRLVLVAAGVPRDALNLFSAAISKAISKNQKLVSITSVNTASSEMAEEKLKEVEQDSGSEVEQVRDILAEVKEFCITEKRKNAFLVEIVYANSRYQLIQKLSALRLVHLLHEGITPHKAGKRFVALMLDYGFYVGIRAARSVSLIPPVPRALSAKELRSLPIFK